MTVTKFNPGFYMLPANVNQSPPPKWWERFMPRLIMDRVRNRRSLRQWQEYCEAEKAAGREIPNGWVENYTWRSLESEAKPRVDSPDNTKGVE
jgi:hypothetical protein